VDPRNNPLAGAQHPTPRSEISITIAPHTARGLLPGPAPHPFPLPSFFFPPVSPTADRRLPPGVPRCSIRPIARGSPHTRLNPLPGPGCAGPRGPVARGRPPRRGGGGIHLWVACTGETASPPCWCQSFDPNLEEWPKGGGHMPWHRVGGGRWWRHPIDEVYSMLHCSGPGRRKTWLAVLVLRV
jgi:hypothetical protein